MNSSPNSKFTNPTEEIGLLMCRRKKLRNALKTKQESKSKKVNTKKKRLTCLHLIKALQKIDINPKICISQKSAPFLPLFFLLVAFTKKQQLKIQTCQSVKLLVSRAIKNSFCQKLSKNKIYNKRNKAIRQKIIWLLFTRFSTCTH